jgi:predicted secreted Zn-dependent protease
MTNVDTTYQVDRHRWASLTLFEQLGNIGSEVGRTFRAKKLGKDFVPAMTRALDLFDATISHWQAVNPNRLREIVRAREQFLAALYVKDDETLEKWFMQFALAARNPNRVTTTA